MNRTRRLFLTIFGAVIAATAVINAANLATAAIITVGNPSFETTPTPTSNGWGEIKAPWVSSAGTGWTTSDSAFYQQNNRTGPAAHFSAASNGDWYALLSGITRTSITQDLSTMVNAGDQLSVTYFAGRSSSGSSTNAGGTLTATFMVGATPYTSSVISTTSQTNNTWVSHTFTQTIANSGNLSLIFSLVSGTPWVDNVSNVTWTPVPEPAGATTLLLSGMVLGLFKFCRRR